MNSVSDERRVSGAPSGRWPRVGVACLLIILFNPGTSGAAPSGKTTTSNPGSLDASFGTRGKVTTEFGLDGVESGRAVAAILNDDGELKNLVVAGCINSRECARHDIGYAFLLARYTPSGGLDPNFGQGTGKVVTYFNNSSGGNSGAGARDVTVTADGKVLSVGGVYMPYSA